MRMFSDVIDQIALNSKNCRRFKYHKKKDELIEVYKVSGLVGRSSKLAVVVNRDPVKRKKQPRCPDCAG